jgi:hypothetical protein
VAPPETPKQNREQTWVSTLSEAHFSFSTKTHGGSHGRAHPALKILEGKKDLVFFFFPLLHELVEVSWD